MQVLRDHELVLSCTRNLVLVFSIAILFTTQDVSGESILSQSWEKETWWHNQRFPSQGGLFRRKRQFPQFVSQFIATDFYIYPSRYKSSKMEHILVFDFFLSFYRLMLHMSMHWVTFKTYFSHLFIVHFNTSFSFHKVYLLFTNLKFKEKKFSFSF